jgi:hypothetical protein
VHRRSEHHRGASRLATRPGLVRHVAGRTAAFTTAAILAGTGLAVSSRAAPEPRHPVQWTGAEWAALGGREKELYLSGFIAGAAAEQARAVQAARRSAPDSSGGDSSARASATIARLKRAGQLEYSYAPSVYAAQIDDFYWWEDHRAWPIVDAMLTINRRMKEPQ